VRAVEVPEINRKQLRVTLIHQAKPVIAKALIFKASDDGDALGPGVTWNASILARSPFGIKLE
jgi:hypothetical protein